MSSKIKDIKYRSIYDSRGVETLEVDVTTESGFGRVAAPFGAPGSRGEFEAPAYAADGIGESKQIIENEIKPKLIGIEAEDQEKIDMILEKVDETSNFERIGGNTSMVISVACAIAAADSDSIPLFKLLNQDGRYTLPYPLGNIIGGGAHSLGPAPDMQEHLIVPLGVKSFAEGVAINLMVHEETGLLLEKKDPSFAGGTDDESAWTANLNDYEAFEVLEQACKIVSDSTGIEIRMGLDLAADRLWDGDKKLYHYLREGISRNTQQQIDYLNQLTERFKLVYVEDAFNSNDYDSFAKLNELVGEHCFVCADDLYASNAERTQYGSTKKAAGIMILKTNQIGSISGLKKTAEAAKENGMSYILSHRSGETPDNSIAHLAVALNSLMIKTGVKGGERLAKLNELIRIEQDIPDIKLAQWPANKRL